MNRYAKKISLLDEAKQFILPTLREDVYPWKDPAQKAIPIEPFDFPALFGNANPVEIEVGFGTGRFIVEYARQNPMLNMLGVEITRKMVHHVANKVLAADIANTRLMHGDGILILKNRVPDLSVLRVHVYFPDPWPKKRHIKRRVVSLDFLSETYRVLKPGGAFHLFTDHKDYFDFAMANINEFGKFIDQEPVLDYIPSSYELKWKKAGRSIYRAVVRKENI